MLIIPAIDIFDGKCVRLRQGDYEQKTVYTTSPLEVAKQFVAAGFNYLHIVDLQGAKEKKIVNWNSIASILSVPGLQAEVGGGIRATEDIHRLLEYGTSRVVIGSVAAKSPELIKYWIQEFKADRIAVGMDVRNGFVAVSGWLEDSQRMPMGFILDLIKHGANTFICTDISRDGMLNGVDIEFYKNLKLAFPHISIFASGGISTFTDIQNLKQLGLTGIIVGKAIYEGLLPLEELVKMKDVVC